MPGLWCTVCNVPWVAVGTLYMLIVAVQRITCGIVVV